MIVLPDADVKRALIIIAHPDDAEFWLGGTLAHWTSAGIEVTYQVLTDGDSGGFDPGVPRSEVPRIRRAEQEKAAAMLGVAAVHFAGLREGELRTGNRELHCDLVRTIRRVRPHRLVTWSPEWNWQRFRSCHPDHLATGHAVLNAVYPDAGNQFAHMTLRDEGLDAWTVPEVWMINSPHREINHYVDVTDTFDRKVAAVRAHDSQVAHRAGELADYLRQRILPNTEPAGLPHGRLAEAFQVVRTG